MPNVSLTPPMQDYVDAQIRAGRYANLSEAVRAGVWKLMREDGLPEFWDMREELAELAARAMAGEGEPFDMREFEPRLKASFDEG